jgi:RNA polymerase sigma factor (sigma-70 family)
MSKACEPVTAPRPPRPGWLGRLFPPRPREEGSDAHLLHRFAKDRDEAAFAALMERHGPMVMGVCRRVLRDAHAADDAFQATFLVLVRKAASLRRPHLLGNWLYGVAYRVALQARAVAARQPALGRQVEEMPAAAVVDEKVWDELRPVLDAEINQLPDKYRVPVVLCHLEGKTYAEAARALGWAEGTVSGRLARAREKLRKRLSHRGVSLSAAAVAAVLCQKGSAAVPAALAQTTLRAALLAATGKAVTAGLVSAQAIALSQTALKLTLAFKLKVLAAVVVLGAAGTGVWALAQPGRPLATFLDAHTAQLAAPDRDRLQGTWDCAAQNLTWTFQGNDIIVRDRGTERRGTYRLDRYLIVHSIIDVNLPAANGLPAVALYGAYEIDGNSVLKVCVNNNPALRPKTVNPYVGNGDVRYDFQKR